MAFPNPSPIQQEFKRRMLLSQIIYFRRFLDSKYCVGETSSIRKYQTSHICRWLFAVTSVFDEARKGVSLSLIRRPRNVVDVVAGRWRRNKRWRVWHNNNIVVVGHTWVSHRVESVKREVVVNALRVSLTRHNAKRFLLPENKSWYKCVLCFRTSGGISHHPPFTLCDHSIQSCVCDVWAMRFEGWMNRRPAFHAGYVMLAKQTPLDASLRRRKEEYI